LDWIRKTVSDLFLLERPGWARNLPFIELTEPAVGVVVYE